MSDYLFVCLHGFLGKGEDWETFKSSIKEGLPQKQIEFWCPSLLSGDSPLGPELPFFEWPERLHRELDKFHYRKCILVGYSMGGRLALSAFIHKPEKFTAAIFFIDQPFGVKSRRYGKAPTK